MVSHLGNGWIEAEALDSGIPVVFATTPDGKHRMPAAGRGGLIA